MRPSEREQMILSLASLVQIIAHRRMRTLPPWARRLDDLISAGWVGAINAVDRFDARLGIPLHSFAEIKINMAIGDYLRSTDRLSVRHRQKVSSGRAEAPVEVCIDDMPIADRRWNEEFERIGAAIDLESISQRSKIKPRSARILLRYMAGEKMKAIGQSYGIGESGVSLTCSRTLRQLRGAL